MPATRRTRVRLRRLLAAVAACALLLAGCGSAVEPDEAARIDLVTPSPPPAATPAAVDARVLTGTVELHGPYAGAAEERCANRDETLDLQSGMTVRVLDRDGEPLGRGWLGDGVLAAAPADTAPACLFPWEIRGVDGDAESYRLSIGGLHELGPWSAEELDALGWDVRLTLGTPGPRPAPEPTAEAVAEAAPAPSDSPPDAGTTSRTAAAGGGRSTTTTSTPRAAAAPRTPAAPAPTRAPAPTPAPTPTTRPAPTATPAPAVPSVTALRLVGCRYDGGLDTVEGSYELTFADADGYLLPGGDASVILEPTSTAQTPGRLSASVPNTVISPRTVRWSFTMATGAGSRDGFTLPVVDEVRLLDASGAAQRIPAAQTTWSWSDAGCGP